MYTKTTWQDNVTPVSAANMNKIEQGVKDAHDAIEAPLYSTPVEATAQVIQLPSTVAKGALSVTTYGQTIVPIMINDCESTSEFSKQAEVTITTSTDKVFGSNSLKIVSTTAFRKTYKQITGISAGDYILCTSYQKKGTGTGTPYWYIKRDAYTGTNVAYKDINATSWTRYAQKLQMPADATSLWCVFEQGSANVEQYIDAINVIKISADEYNNLSEQQLMDKYNFINGVQSTNNAIVKSVGKNLLRNGNGEEGSNYHTNYKGYVGWSSAENCFIVSSTSSGDGHVGFYTDWFNVVAGQTYSIGMTMVSGATFAYKIPYYEDSTSEPNIGAGTSFTASKTGKIRIRYTTWASSGTLIERKFKEMTVVRGTSVLNPYESYTETTASIPVEFKSVNAVKDVFCVTDGKHTKNVEKATITAGTTVNTVNYPLAKNGGQAKIALTAGGEQNGTVGSVNANGDGVLYYELATPVVRYYPINILTAEPSGTIYVIPQVNDVGWYQTKVNIESTSLPIKSMVYVNKINIDTGEFTPISLSSVTVAGDKLSFTVSGAVNGEFYEYGYEYDSTLSTIPSIKYSYPQNIKAAVNDNVDNIRRVDDKLDRTNGIVEELAKVQTIDQTQAPASPGNGIMSQALNWFANRIKAIIGKTNWWDSPTKTMEQLNTDKLETSEVVTTATANKVLKLDSNAKFPVSVVPQGSGSGLNAELFNGTSYAAAKIDMFGIYAAGDNLIYSNDANGSFYGPPMTKVKSCKVGLGGTVRVSFDINRSGSAAWVQGQIYVNGVARGTLRQINSPTSGYVTYTEDITINPMDEIQLYVQSSDVGNAVTYQNFRIKASKSNYLG